MSYLVAGGVVQRVKPQPTLLVLCRRRDGVLAAAPLLVSREKVKVAPGKIRGRQPILSCCHKGDLEGVPGSWLSCGTVLATVGFGA